MVQNVEIVGREFEMTEPIRDYVAKKVARLDRYLNSADETRVELSHISSARSAADRYAVQLTVRGKGYILRAEERADDIRSAVDAATDKMQRQMVRYKDKHYRHGRGDERTTDKFDAPSEEHDQLNREQPPEIVRRKSFDLTPMDEHDALEQMKLLGHDNFFVFYNIQSDRVSVLYRRRDGTYGLIEPHLR